MSSSRAPRVVRMNEVVVKQRRVPSRSHSFRGVRSSEGFTVVELLITASIFIVILAAVLGFLVSGTRAYSVTSERSEALQDSEAVLQLLRYEVAMAGYRGIEASTYGRTFTSGSDETLVVHRTSDGDVLTLRYFEDRFISGSDTGERVVSFYVDETSNALVRQETRPGLSGSGQTTELMVGNISNMIVQDVIGRWREQVSVDAILGGADPPESIAGLNMVIQFVDGTDWEFLIGVSNPQVFNATAGL